MSELSKSSEATKYLLAFDTSSNDIVLNLAHVSDDGSSLQSVSAETFSAPRAANTQLLPHIDAVLAQAGVSKDDLAAVAVGITLGSYTGVRIGIATAKGITHALGIPLFGLPIDEEKLSPDYLLDCFMQNYATQTGDPSDVLPLYTMMSYAEEAEKKQHPARYDAPLNGAPAQSHSKKSGGTIHSFIEEYKAKTSDTQDYCSAKKDTTSSLLLGIETSCDETAAAVMEGTQLLSNVVASQAVFHARFGGVVPEIASRKHSEAIVATVDQAMMDAHVPLSALTGIAVTDRPGLIGALVVGQAYAKGLAWALQIPLYGINHLEGHLYACAIDDGIQSGLDDLPSPHLALIVSGGHTTLAYSPNPHEYETLGETLDDAAGEAFDKVAKVLGLGYPGGPILSKLADQGDPYAIDFPRAMIHSKDYAFSLSGLKTAVITYIREAEQKGDALNIPDVAASFQQAVVDVQVAKAVRAAREKQVGHFIMAGGVAANKVLREALVEALAAEGVQVHIPPFKYCGDNAAMIVRTAAARLQSSQQGQQPLQPLPLDADCSSSASL